MNNETRRYRGWELSELNPNGHFRIKLASSTDEHTSATKWLTITAEEFAAIRAVLMGDDAK